MLRLAHAIALAFLGTLLGPAQAGYLLIGPGFGSVVVNPDNNPGSAPGNTTVATGLVNANNFYTWNTIGADATPLASNALSSLFTTQSTPIASVTLVSNAAANGTALNPTPLPVNGSSNLQRRTTGSSYSADFSGNEALLFANAGNAGLIIDFAVPISAVGFRIQNVGFGTNNNFFMQAFNPNGTGFDPASPLYGGLSVTTSSFTPFSDTAPFYGIGTDNNSTFTRLFIAFDSNTPFAIGTLEVTEATSQPVDPNAVPLPPTVLFAAVGAISLAGLRRRIRR